MSADVRYCGWCSGQAGVYPEQKTLEQYDVRNVSEQMKKIYTELLGD